MGCDEMLFEKVHSGEYAHGIIRFYAFSSAAVTVGMCQKITQTEDVSAAELKSVHITRRITGGGLVRHNDDIPYTLILPVVFHDALKNLETSYSFIHGLLRSALKECGIDSTLARPDGSPFMGIRCCFNTPVADDIIVDGQKIAGAAQKRKKGIILHQGSIDSTPFTSSAQREEMQERFTAELVREMKAESFNASLTQAEYDDALRLASEKYERPEWIYRC